MDARIPWWSSKSTMPASTRRRFSSLRQREHGVNVHFGDLSLIQSWSLGARMSRPVLRLFPASCVSQNPHRQEIQKYWENDCKAVDEGREGAPAPVWRLLARWVCLANVVSWCPGTPGIDARSSLGRMKIAAGLGPKRGALGSEEGHREMTNSIRIQFSRNDPICCSTSCEKCGWSNSKTIASSAAQSRGCSSLFRTHR